MLSVRKLFENVTGKKMEGRIGSLFKSQYNSLKKSDHDFNRDPAGPTKIITTNSKIDPKYTVIHKHYNPKELGKVFSPGTKLSDKPADLSNYDRLLKHLRS